MPTRAKRLKARCSTPRKSAAKRGYGKAWQKASKGYLRKHPLCAACWLTGIVREATVVDHVQPHRGDERLFWLSSNWQSLCKPCHDAKTRRGL
jgi:5-methylcytosine-specific restriction enzyme A